MLHVAVMSESESDPPVQTTLNGDVVLVVVVVVAVATSMVLSILSALPADYQFVLLLGSLLHCAGGEIWTVSLVQAAQVAVTTKQEQVIEVQW